MMSSRRLWNAQKRFSSASLARYLARERVTPSLTSSATVAAGSILLLVTLHAVSTTSMERKNDDDKDAYRMEIDFLEKLSHKPYLQAATVSSGANTRARSGPNDDIEESNSLVQDTTLRLVAADIDVTQGFRGGTCRTAYDKVFPHGIAPDKQVEVELEKDSDFAATVKSRSSNNGQSSTARVSVEQKAWVTSLLECRAQNSTHDKPPGIQIAQADTQALNPHRLMHRPVAVAASGSSVASIRSKLGKFASKELAQRKQQGNASHEVDGESSSATLPVMNDAAASNYSLSLSPVERERVAPWNQHAWIDELELRLPGRVPFDATLQPASWWRRWFLGQTYQAIFPAAAKSPNNSANKEWSWSSLSPSRSSNSLANHHKPHAVIANGAALQAIPKSLRRLQKTCAEQDIPLFVINDPRAWRNTHNDLHQVMRDVRRIVKERITSQSLYESRHGTTRAFERGRLLGRIETEAKHAAKQVFRRRRGSGGSDVEALQRQQYEESLDWKRLSADELMEKLQERGVVQEPEVGVFKYSDSFLSLARRCIGTSSDAGDHKEGSGASP